MMTKKYRAHNALAYLYAITMSQGKANALLKLLGNDVNAKYILFAASESFTIMRCREHKLRGKSKAKLVKAIANERLRRLQTHGTVQ